MLKEYVYHRTLLCAIGKHGCKNIRREYFLEESIDVMIERDYDESLKEEFDM